MAKSNATAAKKVRVMARQALVLELRKRGVSFPKIATLIKQQLTDAPPSYCAATAYSDLQVTLRPFIDSMRETAPLIIELELQRLDDLLVSCLPKAMGGDLYALDRVLKIMERRARYIPGVEAPATLDVTERRIVRLPVKAQTEEEWMASHADLTEGDPSDG